MQMWEQPPLSREQGWFSASQQGGRPSESWTGSVPEEEAVLLRTQVPPVQRVGGVDGREGGQASLHARASLPAQLVHPLDHLLLPVDPVQVVPQDREARWLQDAGVLEDNPIGSWGRIDGAARSRLVFAPGVEGQRSALTCEVTALDAFEVRIHPEEFPHLGVQSQSDGSEKAGGEETLSLRPVQTGGLDLGRALLDGGEVHVPAETSSRVSVSRTSSEDTQSRGQFFNGMSKKEI